MKLTFDTQGNEKQKDCVRAWADPLIKEIVYGGSKGSAKSFTGCSLIFGDALMYPGTHYFIARKTLKDIRSFTIPSIKEVFELWGLNPDLYLDYNGQDSYFTLPNKSRVYLLDAKYLPSDPSYERFGSMQMTRGWMEEAGEFETECKENLQASVGRWKNEEYNLAPKLLQTCNPSKNYLYKIYKANKLGTLDPEIAFIQAYPKDNKMLGNTYIEHLNKTLTGIRKKRLLEGLWEYDDDDSVLMEYSAIIDYWNGQHVKREGDKYMTIDVARKGKDKTKYRVWHGWVCIANFELMHGKDDKYITQKIVDKAREIQRKYKIHNSNTITDEDGVGGGVVDLLGCVGFINGSSQINTGSKTNYRNLKSQCAMLMADKINAREVVEICTDVTIIERTTQEMEQIKDKSFESEGKKEVNSKDDIKKAIGRSPDDWDTIMMRYYFELKPQIWFS